MSIQIIVRSVEDQVQMGVLTDSKDWLDATVYLPDEDRSYEVQFTAESFNVQTIKFKVYRHGCGHMRQIKFHEKRFPALAEKISAVLKEYVERVPYKTLAKRQAKNGWKIPAWVQ